MLIDDDEPTNFLSNMIIEEAGCAEHIQIESSGKKGIDYLVNSQKLAYTDKNYPWPDLVFLDINMPAMNGWEFLVKYNELEKRPRHEIIVVMLTTSLDPNDEVKAKNISGVNDFIHKPLSEDLVMEILEKYFPENFRPVRVIQTVAKE